MFLTINEFGDVVQYADYNKEWEQAVKDGVMSVYKFEDNAFYELDENAQWGEVEIG